MADTIPIVLTQARAVVADLEEARSVLADNRRPRAAWCPRALKDLVPSSRDYLAAYGAPPASVASDRLLPQRFAEHLRKQLSELRYCRRMGRDPHAEIAACLREQAEIREKYPHLEEDISRFQGDGMLPDAYTVLRAVLEYAERWSHPPAGDPASVQLVTDAFAAIHKTSAWIAAETLASYIHPRHQAAYNLEFSRSREALWRGRATWTEERIAELEGRVNTVIRDLEELWPRALALAGIIPMPRLMEISAPPPRKGWWARLRARLLFWAAGASSLF